MEASVRRCTVYTVHTGGQRQILAKPRGVTLSDSAEVWYQILDNAGTGRLV